MNKSQKKFDILRQRQSFIISVIKGLPQEERLSKLREISSDLNNEFLRCNNLIDVAINQQQLDEINFNL